MNTKNDGKSAQKRNIQKKSGDSRRKPSAQSFLSEMLHRIPVPTFVIDLNHNVQHWNLAMEKLTGLRAVDVLGTNRQWKAFYSSPRPVLADLVVDNVREEDIRSSYEGKYWQSSLVESAYEAEDFFPSVGKWLSLTATPIKNKAGEIIGAAETIFDITEKKAAEAALRESERKYRELSVTDSLTKLYNSRKFFRELILETQRANRYNTPLSLILLDIDNFKSYNDEFGHMEGDRALAVLADVIKKDLRRVDNGFRYGGEEFTVLLPETGIEGALKVADRIRKDFEDAVDIESTQLKTRMTVSVGVAEYLSGEEVAVFVKRADGAMYKAKKNNKNCICVG